MRYIVTLLLVLLAVSVDGAVLDSTRQVRVAAYKLLQMDTTGTSALATADMDQWVNVAINKVNEDLSSYKRRKISTMTDGKRLYVLDSCIQVEQCFLITNDSIWALDFIDLDEADIKVFEIVSKTTDDYPTHYYMWGDSIGFIPTPIRADSFIVFYNHLIPNDKMSLFPHNHRLGVVLYTAYLAALDTNKDATPFLQQYQEFVATRKPKAIEGK